MGIGISLAANHFLDLSRRFPLLPRDPSQACIGAGAVWFGQQYSRLFFASITHFTDYHLIYTLSSFLWKGRMLEAQYGTVKFVWTVVLLALLGNCLHVLFALVVFNAVGDSSYLDTCAVGFSGALFGLKVILNHSHNVPPNTTPSIMGFRMDFQLPTKHMAWVELLVVYLFMPYSSFVNNVCGIIAGFIYVSETLDPLFNLPDKLGLGHNPHQQRPNGRYNDGYNDPHYRAR